ncbi:MAG: hypothetical protein B7Y31_14430, partial [Novosphingobium sp. 16-62-11]
MQVSPRPANPALSSNPELLIAETSGWLAENWLRIAIAVGIAAAIVLVLLTVQKLAQRLCREGEALVGWRTIAGRLAARTKFWFLVILAAKIVDNYAAAPLWLDRTITFLFTVGMTVQAAIWARELVLGVVEHRAGDAQHGNGALTSAMSIIRALVTFLIFAIALVLILGNLGVNVAGLVAG